MSATEILSELQRRGVQLVTENGELRFRAKKGALTPELRQAMVRHKTDLVKLLETTHSPTTGHGLCPGPQKCAGCYAISGGRFIHPPKISEEWKTWIAKWEPKKGSAVQ